jgi:hypothetical protein
MKAIDESYEAKSRNDIFENQKSFNSLATAKSFYLSIGMDSSISTGGKTKSLYSKPSYLSTKILKWKGNSDLLNNHYHASVYNEGSFYMEKLLALNEDLSDESRQYKSEARLKEFEVNLFNSLQSNVKDKTVDGTDVSKKDAYVDLYSKLLGVKAGRISYFNGPTPADKSQQYTFSIPTELFVDSDSKMINGVLETGNHDAYEILFKYIRSEHERIKQVQREIDAAGTDESQLKVHYHLGNKNGLKFQLIKSLNFENYKADESNTVPLYNADGRLIDLDLNNSPELKDAIMRIIKGHVTNKVNSTLKHLVKQDILSQNGTDFTVKNLPIDIWNGYSKDSRDSQSEIATKVAADIVFNGIISQVEYSKMFSGDIAYYKNMLDYKKRVPATYTDGQTLYLKNSKDEYFNMAVIDGVEVTTPYINDLKELIGNDSSGKAVLALYENGNSTDAQAWITPERWKFLMKGLGKWNSKYDVVFKKFENSQPLDSEELKMAAQPLKGVYFDINDGVPTYFKYSQAVLLPQLVNNNPELKTLLTKMNEGKPEDRISELITIDGVKVGANKPSSTHNDDGTMKNTSEFKLTPQRLRNEGWKLQQDLPTKTVKSIDVGSQLQKNIFAGLSENLQEEFQIGDQMLTGEQVVNLLHELIGSMTAKGKSKFEQELGISSDFVIKDAYKVNKILIDELISRGANQDHINGLKEGLSTYGLPGANNKVQSVFASIVLDRMIRIKTNGGSFIQMANYGFDKFQAESKGVIWTPWSKDKTYEYSTRKDNDDKVILGENGKPLVKPAGILLSGSFIEKYIPKWGNYTSEQLFGVRNESTGKYENGMIDHEILSNMVGYRIPNQGLASNDAFEIAGILPASMGDTVVAYTSITTKTGSDFDIDKMYMMIPSYKAVRINQDQFRKNLSKLVSGDTIQDVIDNLDNLLDNAFTLSEDDNLILGSLLLTDTLVDENKQAERSRLLDEVIDITLNKPDSKAALAIIDNIEEFNSSTRLEYLKPDYKKGGKQDSLEQMQNMLIEAYSAIITHPSNMKEVLTPIDYEYMKNDIVNLRPQPNNGEFADYLYEYDVELKYDLLGGKSGVGQNANALVNHISGSLGDTYIKEYGSIGRYDLENTENTMSLDNPYSGKMSNKDIEFYIEDYNSRLKNTIGWKESDVMTRSRFKDQGLESPKVSSSLSALLNAYMDIAKDPYITRGNWNTMTANVGFMLLRSGSHPLWVNSFLAQPIIVRYIEFMKSRQSILETEDGSAKEMFLKNENIKISDQISSRNRTLKHLRDNIGGEENSSVNEASIMAFLDLVDRAKGVTIATKASKIDVNGYGRNNVGMIIVQNLFNELSNPIGDTMKGYDTLLDYKNEDDSTIRTSLGSFKDHMSYTNNIMKANPSLFLESNIGTVNTFNHISNDIKNEVLFNDDLSQKLSASYYSYTMSNFGPLQMDNTTRNRLIDTMPKLLTKLKRNYPNNEFVSNLYVKLNPRDIEDNGFIVMSNRGKSTTFETQMSRGWEELLESDEDNAFAQDLIKYSYLTSGFQKNMFEFYSYIPTSWFIDNKLNEYIKRTSNNNSELDITFIEEFARHNVKDNTLVKTINRSQMAISGNVGTQHGFITENYKLPSFVSFTEEVDNSNPFLIPNSEPRLYKNVGYDKDGRRVYVRTHTKGNKLKSGMKIVEWNNDAEEQDRGFLESKDKFKALEDGIKYYNSIAIASIVDDSVSVDSSPLHINKLFEKQTEAIKVAKEVENNSENVRNSKENELPLQSDNISTVDVKTVITYNNENKCK